MLRGLDDAAIDTLVAHHERDVAQVARSTCTTWAARWPACPPGRPRSATASAPFLLNIIARSFTADGYDEAVAWARDFPAAIAPSLTGGTYVNFLTGEGAGARARRPTSRRPTSGWSALKAE